MMSLEMKLIMNMFTVLGLVGLTGVAIAATVISQTDSVTLVENKEFENTEVENTDQATSQTVEQSQVPKEQLLKAQQIQEQQKRLQHVQITSNTHAADKNADLSFQTSTPASTETYTEIDPINGVGHAVQQEQVLNQMLNQMVFAPSFSSVKQASTMLDDQYVQLKGYVVKALGDDKYQFRDSTGSITVDIDHELWMGKPISATSLITIVGEVDVDYRPFKRVEIDVDHVAF